MTKRVSILSLCVLSAALFVFAGCETPVDPGTDGGTPTFVGTWTASDTGQSYTYEFASDNTFVYTWVSNAGTVKYKGTYSHDSGASTYQEIVTDQDYGSGWTSGGWTTNYSYTLNSTTLTFTNGTDYTKTFTKS